MTSSPKDLPFLIFFLFHSKAQSLSKPVLQSHLHKTGKSFEKEEKKKKRNPGFPTIHEKKFENKNNLVRSLIRFSKGHVSLRFQSKAITLAAA